MDDIARQQEYYRSTAAQYDAMHVDPLDEHGIALAFFAGLARHIGAQSILDVGAGTGRGMLALRQALPGVRIVGIEPVGALREVGYAQGISPDDLIDGSGDALPFADNSFDMVIETGVLHHVPVPSKVVREMVRVAARGLLISDCNNFGQGSALVRMVKAVLDKLGLWRAAMWLSTGGKMSKWSEGDGVYYSYCLFDDLPEVAAKFPRRFLANTEPLTGFNLRRGTASGAIIAINV